MNQNTEDLPQLESAIDSENYLDGMSAPRIDPARPEMTGWAMKQNRQKQREGPSDDEDERWFSHDSVTDNQSAYFILRIHTYCFCKWEQ